MSAKGCKESSCRNKHKAFGLCAKHYRQQYYQNHRSAEIGRSLNFKRTFHGRIIVAYQKLRLRCLGRAQKSKSYVGLPFMSQDDFYEWSTSDTQYAEVFQAWESSGFQYRLTPTPDRINPQLGYMEGNLRWLSFVDNCRHKK